MRWRWPPEKTSFTLHSPIKAMQMAVNELFGETGTLEERIQELEKDFETDANIGQIFGSSDKE